MTAPATVPLEDQIFEIKAQLAAAQVRLDHAGDRDRDACQQSVARLDAVLKVLALFLEFKAPARRFFVNCMKIKQQAGSDPTALAVLAELPGAEMRIRPTGAFAKERQ